MTIENITEKFGLFVGEETVAEKYEVLCEEAMAAVTEMMREGADEDDERLESFAAAVAFYRFVEITAARDKCAYSGAGTLSLSADATQKLVFARSLLRDMRRACRTLLRDDTLTLRQI